MLTSMKTRVHFRCVVDAGTGETIRRIAAETGMMQQSTLSRIVDWFSHQPAAIQRMILGWADNPVIAAQIMEQLLAELREKARTAKESKDKARN